MATNTTNYNLIKPAYEDAADIKDINDNMDTIDGALYAKLMTPSAAFNIPTVNTTVYKNMTGITSNHVLLAWQFSGTAYSENRPPCRLQWVTHDGYFGIQNDGPGTPNMTIKPIFGLPVSVATSAHT